MQKEILPVTSIFLDGQNPRLKNPLVREHDAIVEFYLDPNNKVQALAKHIVENGVDPTARLIVMRNEEDSETYTVLEGNRRTCALKVLLSPEILDGKLSEAKHRAIKKLAEQFKEQPIDEVECVVMAGRAEADRWLQLRHTGQNQGAGTVEWEAEQKGRYLTRLNQAKPLAIQVLDFVNAHGSLSDAARQSDRKITDAIRRVASDKDFQEMAGYRIVNNKLHSYFPEAEVAKALTKLVQDFKLGLRNTNDVHGKDDRNNYIQEFKPVDKPAKKTKGAELRELDSDALPVTAAAQPTPTVTTTVSAASSGKNRSRLVPTDFRISVNHKRIALVFGELKKLRFDANTQASGILLRVFVEMSLDHFIEINTVPITARRGKPTLTEKVLGVCAYLETLVPPHNVSAAKLRGPRKFASTTNQGLANVDSLHAFVHDKEYYPAPSELRTTWDNIETFISRLWA